RSGPLHAAGGAGESVGRARAGHRIDDGRRGGDGAAGTGAVRGVAAVLHRGVDGGEREGVIFLLAAVLWTAHPSDGVTMKLTREDTVNRLALDFLRPRRARP